jgi:predicted transcriptional regulator
MERDTLSIRLDRVDKRFLRRLARARKLQLSAFVREILEERVERMRAARAEFMKGNR